MRMRRAEIVEVRSLLLARGFWGLKLGSADLTPDAFTL